MQDRCMHQMNQFAQQGTMFSAKDVTQIQSENKEIIAK